MWILCKQAPSSKTYLPEGSEALYLSLGMHFIFEGSDGKINCYLILHKLQKFVFKHGNNDNYKNVPKSSTFFWKKMKIKKKKNCQKEVKDMDIVFDLLMCAF